MKTSAAIKHYGSRYKIAQGTGLSKQAVYKWGSTVPIMSAVLIERRTAGKLKVNLSDYK